VTFFAIGFAWLIDRRADDLMKMLIKVAGLPDLPVLTASSTGRSLVRVDLGEQMFEFVSKNCCWVAG